MQLDRLCLMTERLRYENEHLRLENMTLSSKVELMKQIMMEFDTQRLEEEQEDKVISSFNKLVLIRAIADRESVTLESTQDPPFWWHE